MKPMKLFCVGLSLLILPTLVFGQLKQDKQVDMASALIKPSGVSNMVGLLGLDPNKFSMSHSYSFSFSSLGGQSFGQGVYLNTMHYQFSDPLTMYFQFGFLHRPFGDFGQTNLSQNELFVSGAGFKYQPADNFKVQFEFSQQPRSYYYSSPLNRVGARKAWWETEEHEKE
ncbi:hypothetical protein GWO43_26505 [candidate division KSB1 bacterium]|nr:hypothetical protein [candidate division KSB1 bacterium]NIR70068.1 hypothetical protein [candidate division KSB1 bacterium]NIS27506.1 hypothetical protein [candidate division KSB1 bacterium]NIT74355.1 hypothetical protein [candidate division KSB1 bacterium]NIU28224.1 hypothetical protein [candidate division KSB1 bacterium]